MRVRSAARGFSLREMLIAMAIVALLLAIFVPLLSHRYRPAGRRSTCQNNLRQCGLALLQVQDTHQRFPGYANEAGGKRASWIVPILPQLERMDLHRNWQRQDMPFQPASPIVAPSFVARLDVLICPSSVDVRRYSWPDLLSYVVNSGSARTANDFLPPIRQPAGWVEDLASGVFFNRARADWDAATTGPRPWPEASAFQPAAAPVATLDYIARHDGTTYTVMLSENLQASTWATNPLNPRQPLQSEFQMRQATAMVWFVTGRTDNTAPPSPEVAREGGFDPHSIHINGRRHLGLPLPVEYRALNVERHTGGLAAARPSGAHPGGVNVIFCGGNGGYISEEIDYRVYTQLMTPNSPQVVVDLDAQGNPIRADAQSGTSSRVRTPWLRPLDETEF